MTDEEYRDAIEKQRREMMNAITNNTGLSGIAGAAHLYPNPYGPGGGGSNLQSAAKSLMEADNGRTVVFDGRIRVTRVNNGYIVEIGNRPHGEISEVSIAKDIHEVNDLIAAAMVSFRLEEGSA